MKTTFDKNGTLQITPESPTEAMALYEWQRRGAQTIFDVDFVGPELEGGWSKEDNERIQKDRNKIFEACLDAADFPEVMGDPVRTQASKLIDKHIKGKE